MKTCMFESLGEVQFISEITALINDLVYNFKESINNLNNNHVDYRHLNIISAFLFQYKEIYIVSVLKLRALKVENIINHALFDHLKFILNNINPIITDFFVLLSDKSDEFYTPTKNYKTILRNLEEFII